MDSEDLITGCLNWFCGFHFKCFVLSFSLSVFCLIHLLPAFKAPVPRLQELNPPHFIIIKLMLRKEKHKISRRITDTFF